MRRFLFPLLLALLIPMGCGDSGTAGNGTAEVRQPGEEEGRPGGIPANVSPNGAPGAAAAAGGAPPGGVPGGAPPPGSD